MKILRLPADVANKIAAGEVVERPASVVKELVENSIDAGALNVSVEITDGGLGLIRVVDDGAGMDRDDAKEAFERHATSKIRSADELFHINTLGFRGEALPSIASVSKVLLTTRHKGSDEAWKVELTAGALKSEGPASGNIGTAVEVEGLFFNTPARLKYLKSRQAEARRVEAALERAALANPQVSFTLSMDGTTSFRSDGDGRPRTAARAVLGRSAEKMAEGRASSPGIEVFALVAGPGEAKRRRQDQFLIVNGRPVSSTALYAAIDRGLEGVSMPYPYPPVVLWLEVDPSRVDVNVHPAKAEVRFADESAVFAAVRAAVLDAVTGPEAAAEIEAQQAGLSSITGGERSGAEITAAGRVMMGRYSGYLGDASARSDEHSLEVVERSATRYGEGHLSNDGSSASHAEADNTAALPYEKGAIAAERLKVIGQFKLSYIIAETAGTLLIIDQHVAHERILVDRFLMQVEKGILQSQTLLMPQTVELMPSEAAVMRDEQEVLRGLGFDVEPFGARSAILRAVPIIGGGEPSAEELLIEAIRDLAEERREGSDVGGRMRSAAVEMACKGAVKAGSYLEYEQMDAILRDLFECENPYRCPHGRPILLKIDLAGIERGVGRR